MAQKIRVQLAAYDGQNQKFPGTDYEYEVEKEDLSSLSIPDGYTWPEGTMYLGFWLPDFSQMLIKIVPTAEGEEPDDLPAGAVAEGQ